MVILEVILIAWFVWIYMHLLLMGLSHPTVCCYTGFRIVIPKHVVLMLTEKEHDAVYAHERGHQVHGHIWKNFLRFCFFIGTSYTTQKLQEIEADDYAVEHVGAEYLARALRKIGPVSEFDLFRIERLERSCGMQATSAPRIGVLHNGESHALQT